MKGKRWIGILAASTFVFVSSLCLANEPQKKAAQPARAPQRQAPAPRPTAAPPGHQGPAQTGHPGPAQMHPGAAPGHAGPAMGRTRCRSRSCWSRSRPRLCGSQARESRSGRPCKDRRGAQRPCGESGRNKGARPVPWCGAGALCKAYGAFRLRPEHRVLFTHMRIVPGTYYYRRDAFYGVYGWLRCLTSMAFTRGTACTTRSSWRSCWTTSPSSSMRSCTTTT